jgi:peptidoglycan hydrolase-like protein with peptidoglycan-binding domain
MKNIHILVAFSFVVLLPVTSFAATAASLFTHVATPKPNVACTVLTSSFGKGTRDTSKNTQVTKLQNFLNATGYLSVAATGYFGPATEAALKAYQKNTISGGKTIPSTGFIGSITRAAIQAATCGGGTLTTTSSATTTVPPCPVGYVCDVRK